MKDIIQEDKRFLKGSNELKLYSKKFYAQYKKTTFHNKIIIVKESSPYKIEEIKEEKREQKNLISEEKNYKIYQIHHIAIKAKKRIIENGETKNWENIENKSNIESSRILSTDKLEIKTTYEENLINELKEDDKIIQIYKKYKITKEFLNGAEIKHKKELIYTKKISKKIILESTEKKQYKEDMEFCEDIVKEEIITELDDGSEPVKDLKEISRKKRYFKTIYYNGPSFNQKCGYIIYTKVRQYKREDETDENCNNIIKKGIEKEIGEKIIEEKEERHVISTTNEDYLEPEEEYEYRDIQRIKENRDAKIATGIGAVITAMGAAFARSCPPIGIGMAAAGGITTSVSFNFQGERYTVQQRRRIIYTHKYLVVYNLYNDNTREQVTKTHISWIKTEEKDWEDI